MASGWPCNKGHGALLKNSLYARFDPMSGPKQTVFGAFWSFWSPFRSHFRLGADFFNRLAVWAKFSEDGPSGGCALPCLSSKVGRILLGPEPKKGARVGINQRISLRKFIDDIRRWVEEGRSDDWIASALGTSPSSVQSFRSRNAIYRRGARSALHKPKDFSSYEGVLEPAGSGVWFDPEIGNDPRWQKRWEGTERVELRLTPSRIVLLRRWGAGAIRTS